MQRLILIVSIHAPAKGATLDGLPYQTCSFVSIHAPAKGATLLESHQGSFLKSFNPRSREGSDGISSQRVDGLSCFNPRSREGSDIGSGSFADTILMFQSTLPRRERLVIFPAIAAGVVVSIHAPAKGAT